eukprot:SM000061S19270  [mRNA]  locus=s61:407613:416763:- [translate_table: standard]
MNTVPGKRRPQVQPPLFFDGHGIRRAPLLQLPAAPRGLDQTSTQEEQVEDWQHTLMYSRPSSAFRKRSSSMRFLSVSSIASSLKHTSADRLHRPAPRVAGLLPPSAPPRCGSSLPAGTQPHSHIQSPAGMPTNASNAGVCSTVSLYMMFRQWHNQGSVAGAQTCASDGEMNRLRPGVSRPAPLRLPKKLRSALAAASSACLMMLHQVANLLLQCAKVALCCLQLALSVSPGGFQLHVGSLEAFVGLLDMDRRSEICAPRQLRFGFIQALGHALTPLVYRALSAVNVALQQRTLAPEHLHLPFYSVRQRSITSYYGPDTEGTMGREVADSFTDRSIQFKHAVLEQGYLLFHEIPHLHTVCPFSNKLLLNLFKLVSMSHLHITYFCSHLQTFPGTGTFSARLGNSLGSSKINQILRARWPGCHKTTREKQDLQSDTGNQTPYYFAGMGPSNSGRSKTCQRY